MIYKISYARSQLVSESVREADNHGDTTQSSIDCWELI